MTTDAKTLADMLRKAQEHDDNEAHLTFSRVFIVEIEKALRECGTQYVPSEPKHNNGTTKGLTMNGSNEQVLEYLRQHGWFEAADQLHRFFEEQSASASPNREPGYMGDVNGPGCDPDVP